mmetsp:Transcript_16918/g.38212  ORF Transcript_16918/g.38212 Transcript_16918/m.38212 type:complete len:389 (-) Transcript_16918:89-1255(-)
MSQTPRARGPSSVQDPQDHDTYFLATKTDFRSALCRGRSEVSCKADARVYTPPPPTVLPQDAYYMDSWCSTSQAQTPPMSRAQTPPRTAASLMGPSLFMQESLQLPGKEAKQPMCVPCELPIPDQQTSAPSSVSSRLEDVRPGCWTSMCDVFGEVDKDLPSYTLSEGSRGHPHSCRAPCKFVRRKRGCYDGAACDHCHICHWRRFPEPSAAQEGLFSGPEIKTEMGFKPAATEALSKLIQVAISEESSRQPTFGDTPESAAPAPSSTLGLAECPSVGSLGHPHSCGLPCKYAGKATGCKDGWLCARCHLCSWHRRKPANGENGFPAVPEVCAETSLGSVGHPGSCSSPCKYARRKGGCQHGWQCSNCHLCRWTRRPLAKEDNEESENF